MSFLFPSLLTIGLPLVAVPVLIHLINLRRQQRIRWAAMQFLVESQRRNRRWILLKQLLLLATRMGLIAVLVLMLSHLVLRNEWMSLLGRGTTHHLILLDDSYSMSDQWDNTSAMAKAKLAVQGIVDQAHAQSDTQLITLLRFSEAARLSAGAQPSIFAEPINEAFRSRLESQLAAWDISQTDVGPVDAIKAIPRLPLANDGQTLVMYLVSDFRAREFTNAAEIRNLLFDLEQEKALAQIHLVRCVREERSNLAITSLEPVSGVRAAGVEMWMSVTVVNYGDEPVRGITVQLEQDGDALPSLALDEIAARDEIKHKFRVQFADTGSHSLIASLGSDAVDLDNRRYFACEMPAALPVLIIDGSPDGLGGRQLSLALAPGGNTRTGWQPQVEPRTVLQKLASSSISSDRAEPPAAVCLLDVSRFSDDELAALEAYVSSGGGVAFFVGAQVDRAFYNDRLYLNGEGLFPVPLKLPSQLMDRVEDATPDLEVTSHPLFQVFAGRRNSFLPLVLVDYYYALPDDWTPADEKTQVIARLRNKAPLAIEKRYGEGRVIAQLTKLSSGNTPLGRWSNWSLNPAFPVLANELVSYLANNRQADPLYQVGDDLIVDVEEGKYENTFRFLLPTAGANRAELPLDAVPQDGRLTAKLEDVSKSGVYEVQIQTTRGEIETRSFAVNVPTGEGDLALIERSQLSQQLAGVDYHLHDAEDMTLDAQQLAGFQMSDALLAALVVMLIVEQLLAYLASYHVGSLRGSSR